MGTINPNIHAAASHASWRLPLTYGMIAPCVMISDVLLLASASVTTGMGYNRAALGELGEPFYFIGVAWVVASLVVTVANLRGLYTPESLLSVSRQIAGLAVIWCLTFLFLTAAAFALKVGEAFSRGAVLSFACGGFVALMISRGCWRRALAGALSRGSLTARRILLVASDAELSLLATELSKKGLQIAKFVSLPARSNGGDEPECRRVAAEVIGCARGSDIEEIFISGTLDCLPSVIPMVKGLRALPLPVRFIPDSAISDLVGRPLHRLGSSIVVEVQRGPYSSVELAAKRSLDLIVAGFALLMLAPLFLLTAVAIKLDSPGPVLFRQQRRGFNGRPFDIIKFRSMTVMENDAGLKQARVHDPRVTRVGRWIRRTSIDELPQLINVVQGKMSLVGPRPHASGHDADYDVLISKYYHRHRVKPGLTGWAQISGARGETPTVESMARRVDLDLWYIDNWSLWLDIRIMLRTVGEVCRTNGAY
jgi:Undecaprenyl-phosphate glucose phosphotransferase